MTVLYIDSMTAPNYAMEWLNEHPGRLSVDTETTGLDVFEEGFEVGVVAFGHSNGDALVLNGRDRELVRAVTSAAFRGRFVWAHHAMYDSWVLRKVFGLRVDSLRCSQVAARVARPGQMSYSLKAMRPTTKTAQDNLKARWEEVSGKKVLGSNWLPEAVRGLSSSDPALIAYVAEDAVETARLVDELVDAADELTRDAMLAEVRVDQVWRWAGYGGLRLDVDRAKKAHTEATARLASEIEHFGFNPATGNKAKHEWAAAYGIVLPLTDKGAMSFSKGARKFAEVPDASRTEWLRFCQTATDAAKMGKLKEMLEGRDDDRVHPHIGVNTAARTGRMSISGPALQNLAGGAFEPGVEDDTGLRGLLLADSEMVLVGCDLSHVEPSIMAAASGDPLLQAHCEPGMDVYVEAGVAVWGEAAREVGEDGDLTPAAQGMRKKMKVVVLALMYGMGDKSLASSLGVSIPEAAAVRKKVLTVYPKVGRWIDARRADAKRCRTLRTLSGRPLPDVRHKPYLATNYTIQGSAADLFKSMCVEVSDKLPAGARLWLPVHDELVVECRPEAVDEVVELLASCMRREVEGVLVWGEPKVLGEKWAKA